jgi:hypothetical protein
MADFSPNWTPRVKLRYRTLGDYHNIQVRLPIGTVFTGAAIYLTRLATVLSANPGLRYTDWSAVSASFITQDTGISLPMEVPTIDAGTTSVPSNPGWRRAVYGRFEARGGDGSKTNITLLGAATSLTSDTDNDLVALPGEAGYPADLIGALTELGNQFRTGSGAFALWYPKMNIGINKKWARKVRGG